MGQTTYEEELAAKKELVESYIGKYCKNIHDVAGMYYPFHYRNKVHAVFGRLKNEVIADVKGYVTDTAKSAFLNWVKDKVLPSAREMAEAYIEAVKASGKEETGWCKARDTLVIPALISCGLWLTEQAVSKVVEQK